MITAVRLCFRMGATALVTALLLGIGCGEHSGHCDFDGKTCPSPCIAIPGDRYEYDGQCVEPIPVVECAGPDTDFLAPQIVLCRVKRSTGEIYAFAVAVVSEPAFPGWRECTGVEQTLSTAPQCP